MKIIKNENEVEYTVDAETTKINGAWYIDTMPTKMVIELENGSLKLTDISPFRILKAENLSVYKGYHPRKIKGNPVPSYLYKFYGLLKNEESLTEVVRTRVSPSQLEKLESYAKNNDKSASEVIRDFIESL